MKLSELVRRFDGDDPELLVQGTKSSTCHPVVDASPIETTDGAVRCILSWSEDRTADR